MTTATATINNVHLERLERKLKALQERLGSKGGTGPGAGSNARLLRPFMFRVAAIVYQSVMKNFDDEGTDIRPWQPISNLTKFIRAHRKSAPNKDPRILQDRGELRRSIYPNVEGNDTAVVSTNLAKARLLQKGGRSPGSTVQIGAFWRRRPKGGEVQRNAKTRIDKKTAVRVREYTMQIKPHRVPARPFLHIRREYRDRIFSAFKAYMREGFTA